MRISDWSSDVCSSDLVFVTSQECGNNAVRPGLKVSRPRTEAGAEELLGLRVATVSETILACCRVLNLLDAVTVIECAVHAGDITVTDLDQISRMRRRGAPTLRRALRWGDGRAESIWEVLVREIGRAQV